MKFGAAAAADAAAGADAAPRDAAVRDTPPPLADSSYAEYALLDGGFVSGGDRRLRLPLLPFRPEEEDEEGRLVAQ